MADFTLNAPGTTNNPWTPANVIVPVSTIQSDTNGWRASNKGVYACFAHNVNYGPTITTTFTIGTGATSNGDDLILGALVRSGANAGAGIGIVVGAFSCFTTTWNTAGTETAISSGVSITRANADVWTCVVSISGGTATITAKQNATPISFSANTTTSFTGEASLAAGGGFEPFNNNSIYLSQFTGTGITGSNTGITPTVGSTTVSADPPTLTPGTNTVVTPFVARHGSGVLEPDRRLILPAPKKIFLPTYRKAA